MLHFLHLKFHQISQDSYISKKLCHFANSNLLEPLAVIKNSQVDSYQLLSYLVEKNAIINGYYPQQICPILAGTETP